MKKIIPILLSSAILLAGCAKTPEKVNETETTTTTTIEETEATVILEPTGSSEESSEAELVIEEPEFTGDLYSVEGMSSDDLYNFIISLSQGINDSDNIDNYADRFSVEPATSEIGTQIGLYDGNSYEFYFTPEDTDYINFVNVVTGFDEDGTVILQYNSHIEFSVTLSDYDLATDLYAKLYDYLEANTPNQDGGNFDSRNGDNWISYIACKWQNPNDGNYYACSMNVILMADGDNYVLSVDVPILP